MDWSQVKVGDRVVVLKGHRGLTELTEISRGIFGKVVLTNHKRFCFEVAWDGLITTEEYYYCDAEKYLGVLIDRPSLSTHPDLITRLSSLEERVSKIELKQSEKTETEQLKRRIGFALGYLKECQTSQYWSPSLVRDVISILDGTIPA